MRIFYPVSMPQDIAQALGISLPAVISFDKLIHILISLEIHPSTLSRYMSRKKAEDAFASALKKEKFATSTVFSYYFKTGWMEFVLQFDPQSRLRRIYLQHQSLHSEDGIELPLSTEGDVLN